MSDLDNTTIEEATLDNEVVNEEIASAPVEDTQVEATAPAEAPVEALEEKAEEVISTSMIGSGSSEPQVLGNVHGAIGTTTAPAAKKAAAPKKTKKDKETVAVYSTKNVTWPGVGKVYLGYNIVGKEESEKWLTRAHIRLATPEEVAKEFGK
jgi:hypothetical protein